MRVALAHDYLTQRGGAERVALQLCSAFPGAPLYTAIYNEATTYPKFRDIEVRTSRLQNVGAFRKDPRLALPFLARTWSQTLAAGADAVVVSSSGWAHGIAVDAGVPKLVYCHNPPRWIYQPEIYTTRFIERAALAFLRRRLHGWDLAAAATACKYFANSSIVAARIWEAYGISATVMHPPVAINADGPRSPIPDLKPGYLLTVARGRGYKNADIVRRAVADLPDEHLVVVGSHPGSPTPGPNSTQLGVVSDSQLRWLYANAKALITVSFEDFGLTPLEANAFGTPVLALRAGGHLDSVVEGVSGSWIEDATPDAVKGAILRLSSFDRARVRQHAGRFSAHRFCEAMLADVKAAIEQARSESVGR
jgi:glycosyltransferase involved in cell wall biosynthesis